MKKARHALALYEYIIIKTAERLREALAQDKEDEPAGLNKGEDEPAGVLKNKRIHLGQAQYAQILDQQQQYDLALAGRGARHQDRCCCHLHWHWNSYADCGIG